MARKKTTAIDTNLKSEQIEITSTSQLRCFDRTIIDTFIFMSNKDTFRVIARSNERATTQFVDTNFVARFDTISETKKIENKIENPLMAQRNKGGACARLLAAVAIILSLLLMFFALRLKYKK